LPDVCVEVWGNCTQANAYYSKVPGQTRFNFYTTDFISLNSSDNISLIFNSYIINGSTTPVWINTTFDNVNVTSNNSNNIVVGGYSDYFERENNSDIGPDWVETLSTSYEINSNSLQITSATILGRGALNKYLFNYTDIIFRYNAYATSSLSIPVIFFANSTNASVATGYRISITSQTLDNSTITLKYFNNNSNIDTTTTGTGTQVYMNDSTVVRIHYNNSGVGSFYIYFNDTLRGILDSNGVYNSGYFGIGSSSSAYQGIYDIRVLGDVNSGNLTTYYDSGSGNEVYQIDVNVTTPDNTNYTVWYSNNSTSSYSQLGGTLTGNNSLNISGTRYQNTDVQIRLAGNQTVTPELIQVTLYDQPAGEGDTTPPISVTNPQTSTGNFYVNNTWVNPADADFNHTFWAYSNGTQYGSNLSNVTTSLNITYSPHATQNLSAQTVDISGNVNSTLVWFNATIPDNAIIISNITEGYNYVISEGQALSLDANYSDLDNDTGVFDDNSSEWNINTASGVVYWLTVDGNQGTYYYYVNVTNSTYNSVDTVNFSVTVSDSTPSIPVITGNTSGNFWVNYTFTMGSNTNSLNVSQNSTWVNGTTTLYNNSSVGSHGWSNISVCGYNSTLNIVSSCDSDSIQVSNNIPVLASIGNKNVIAGNYLNFSINASDLDTDTVTYGTNASNGSLNNSTGNYSWLPAEIDVGVYSWYFNASDGYGGIDTETITVTVNSGNGSPAITYYDPASLTPTVDVNNLYTFNSGANQSVNWTWTNVTEGIGDGTTNSTATQTWTTTGLKTVTVTCSNANGSCGTIQWDVTVVSDGSGGGTDYDWATGYVRYPNGTVIPDVTIQVNSTPIQSTTTNAFGQYTFTYIFVHGDTYWFNFSKLNHNYSNQSIAFLVGDSQTVNATLERNYSANITSWSNTNTSDASLTLAFSLNVSASETNNVTFNITANQTITGGCTWTGATQINCSNTTSYAYNNFSTAGIHTVIAQVSNINGTSNPVTWTVTITDSSPAAPASPAGDWDSDTTAVDTFGPVGKLLLVTIIVAVLAIMLFGLTKISHGEEFDPFILVIAAIVIIIVLIMYQLISLLGSSIAQV